MPDAILQKPAKLTPEEFEEMKRHPSMATRRSWPPRRCSPRRGSGAASSFLRYAREITRSHHEKWDGSGYPDGMGGDDIPLSARLMALADVYDALISKRCYKPPYPHSEAVRQIVEGRGRHFDPDVVDAFCQLDDEFADDRTQLRRMTAPLAIPGMLCRRGPGSQEERDEPRPPNP